MRRNHIFSQDEFISYCKYVFTLKSDTWGTLQKEKIIYIYNTLIHKVDAYRRFIGTSKAIPTIRKEIPDFNRIPPVTKQNYLKKFPWNELQKQGKEILTPATLTATSGSTGTPFYFPRTKQIDLQSAFCHQMFLQNLGIKKSKKILVIDCFGMGVWIGGIITYQAFRYISDITGSPISIITPGISAQEIFSSLRTIGRQYDHIIICGYPPFVKDVVDQGPMQGVLWKDFSLSFIFAAEGFSEEFRDYIFEKTSTHNIYRNSMNIYGSADLGSMAQETPLAILLRRLAIANKKVYAALFKDCTRLPTLAQYNPIFVSFEERDGVLYVSGDNVLPLLRYDIGDRGGVFTYSQIVSLCKSAGVNLVDEIQKAGIRNTIHEMPFVYVYERADFSTTLYGALIYPEYIKRGLASPEVASCVSGRFTMSTQYDDHQDQYLEIVVECQHTITPTKKLVRQVVASLHKELLKSSTEYSKISESLKERVLLQIILTKKGESPLFSLQGKQKWVKK